MITSAPAGLVNPVSPSLMYSVFVAVVTFVKLSVDPSRSARLGVPGEFESVARVWTLMPDVDQPVAAESKLADVPEGAEATVVYETPFRLNWISRSAWAVLDEPKARIAATPRMVRILLHCSIIR